MRSTQARDAWHAVLFYEDDQRLSQLVVDFIASPNVDDRAIVVCTEAHWSMFSTRLSTSGHDVERELADGRITVLDARSTLSCFVRDEQPDEALFRAAIEPLVRSQADRKCGRVLVYGEMVDLLCQDGMVDAALTLEQFWNGLHQETPFWLLCGYFYRPLRSRPVDLKRICGAHTHVIHLTRVPVAAHECRTSSKDEGI